MTEYGVTENGFSKKTLTDIQTELGDAERAAYGPDMNTLATAVCGQLNGIFGDKVRELWDVLQAVYSAFYPDSATGAALDGICAITGTERLEASKSEVTLDRMYLEAGAIVPSGSQVSAGANGPRFATTAELENATSEDGVFSVAAESVDYGPIPAYAEQLNTIQTPESGWFDTPWIVGTTVEPFALNGKTLTFILDESGVTKSVTFTGADPWTAIQAAQEILNQTTDTRAKDAGSGHLLIGTKTSGGSIQVTGGSARTVLGLPTDLIKGFNTLDAEPGTLEETDPDLRTRRERLLRSIGAGTLDAIRAFMLADSLARLGVEQAFVFENTSIYTDSEGLPGKAFEVVILGATGYDQEIAEAIWKVKPTGILAYGDISKTVIDSAGFSHQVSFTRPTEIPIYMALTATRNTALFPLNGSDQIKQALVNFGDQVNIGDDLIALSFRCVPLTVAGVVDLPVFKIDKVDPPVNTGNLVIGSREIATFDTSRIVVTLA